MRCWLLLPFVLGVVAGSAVADSRSFDIDHLQLALTRSEFFATESASEIPRWDWRAGVGYRFTQSPLVIESAGKRIEVIRDRSVLEVQAAVELDRWVGVGVAVPIVVADRGSADVKHGAAFGDVRIVPRVELYHHHGVGLALLLGVRVPSGASDRFVGEGNFVFEPAAAVAVKLGIVSLGADLQFRFRSSHEYFDLHVGNEVALHVAAAITPKSYFSTVIELHADSAMSSQFAHTQSSPVEVLLGMFGQWRGFRAGAAAGVGLVEGWGTPRVRVVALAEYRRPIPPPIAPSAPTPPRPVPPPVEEEPELEEPAPIEETPELDPEPEISMEEPSVTIFKNRIELAEPIFFVKDRQRVRSRYWDELAQLARILVKRADMTVIWIEGHADATGPETWNMELSRRRAGSVARFLVAHGVPIERMRPVGFGEARPLVATPRGEANEKNRRVHFFVDSESELPEGTK